jgi:cytochrome c553
MKRCLFLLSILMLCIFIACSYERKLGIDMPEGFSKEREKQILQQFAEGKNAYINHCAKCHNKTADDKEVIPDISFQQTDTYRVRFANSKHKAALGAETVTEQELDMIVIFFTYKKESGIKAFADK